MLNYVHYYATINMLPRTCTYKCCQKNVVERNFLAFNMQSKYETECANHQHQQKPLAETHQQKKHIEKEKEIHAMVCTLKMFLLCGVHSKYSTVLDPITMKTYFAT